MTTFIYDTNYAIVAVDRHNNKVIIEEEFSSEEEARERAFNIEVSDPSLDWDGIVLEVEDLTDYTKPISDYTTP